MYHLWVAMVGIHHLLNLAGAEALNNTFITNHYSAEDPDETIQNFVKIQRKIRKIT